MIGEFIFVLNADWMANKQLIRCQFNQSFKWKVEETS